jgi:hypothetical protein
MRLSVKSKRRILRSCTFLAYAILVETTRTLVSKYSSLGFLVFAPIGIILIYIMFKVLDVIDNRFPKTD